MSKVISAGGDMTIFGQLTDIEVSQHLMQKKTVAINNHLCEEIEDIKDMQVDFVEMQKEAKLTGAETRAKLLEETQGL